MQSAVAVHTRCSHAITSWLAEHSADLLSKSSMGRDGHTPYERWKGKKTKQDPPELGDKVH